MTPAARLQAAIDILESLEATAQPADRFLRDWFRARRYAGSKDRAAVAERVYAVLRHRASYAWRMGEGARAAVIASLLADGGEAMDALFAGQAYGPAPLSATERARLIAPPTDDPPLSVKGEYPPFLEEELRRAFGERLLEEMLALQSRAPIDLRVNALKAGRADVLSRLKAEDFDAVPTRYSPFAIRVAPGAKGLERTEAFADGLFEFQDEASQIAALLCGARAGMRVLDLAAGAGGKALALAAAMNNAGEILAFDDNAERLKPLAERAARAGAGNITIATKRGGPLWRDGKFDLVLIDAPCSGTGTWRRQPELRWRITLEKLAALTKTQDELLDDGARHVRPGGWLVYATCSLLPSENEDRIARFLAAHADFAAIPAANAWREAVGTPPPSGLVQFFRASPLSTGTDGFFTAVLQRAR
jgi:16S rRNA (cytosine967-C5)-methyltransferase